MSFELGKNLFPIHVYEDSSGNLAYAWGPPIAEGVAFESHRVFGAFELKHPFIGKLTPTASQLLVTGCGLVDLPITAFEVVSEFGQDWTHMFGTIRY